MVDSASCVSGGMAPWVPWGRSRSQRQSQRLFVVIRTLLKQKLTYAT